MAVKNQRKKKKRSTGFWPKLLTMAAVVAAVVLCIAIFFKVGSVTVTGNVRYSAEEVIAASGIETGSNLLMVNRSNASAQILARLPYVTEARVRRTLPDSVSIEVTECSAAAVVSDAYGGAWLLAPDGRLLEQADGEMAQRYPRLTGVTAAEPQAGAVLTPGEGESATAATVSAVLGALADSSVAGQIVSIDFEKSYAIRMMYGELYEINLGGTDDLAYKFSYLEQILVELAERDPSAGGQIDLTLETEKVARFLPW